MTRRPPRDARIIEWLQRINAQYGAVVRWLSVAMLVLSYFQHRAEGVTFFGGIVASSFIAGKATGE
jgi:hypothetical protein